MRHSASFRFSIRRKILGTFVVLTVCAAGITQLCAQELLGKYEAQYQTESDPVQKAKILAKLGPLEIDQARKRLDADQDEASLAVLERYRDDVRQAVAALIATKTDAEKHPAGFKELQIGLRETLRRMDDFIVAVPVDKRPWFRAVRSDLVDLQGSLLDSLFPKPGAGGTKTDKAR